MNNDANDRQWLLYIETLRANSRPVRIDAVLQKRMATFIAARHAKLQQTE